MRQSVPLGFAFWSLHGSVGAGRGLIIVYRARSGLAMDTQNNTDAGRLFRAGTVDQLPAEVDDPLFAMASHRPTAAAVITPERTLNYAGLERLVASTARRLRELGCRPGSRIGICLPNGWRLLVLLLAVIRAGGIACPISTRLPLPGVKALLRRVAAARFVAVYGDQVDAFQVLTPDDLIREAHGGERPPAMPVAQPATIIFTSGTTGEPKAALHSIGNHYFSALGSNENIALETGDRWLLTLPLYHVGGLGLVFRCILAGATVVVPEPGRAVAEAVPHYGATHLSLVAVQLERLMQAEKKAVSTALKALLVGGSAVPPALIRAAGARGYPLYTTYGLTEMTSQVTTTPPGASLAQLATSGQCLRYREINAGADGEILVRGAVLFQGYVEAETLHQPLDPDGWFHTGDRGDLDDAGYLHVRGRLDNMFISGGENIHPEEIERVLGTLAGVRRVVVVPVADPTYGHRPVALVEMHGTVPARAVFEAHLAAQLPRFKIPVAFYAWPASASSQGMKVDRAFLRRYAEERRKGKS